jgi:hypothetical protein
VRCYEFRKLCESKRCFGQNYLMDASVMMASSAVERFCLAVHPRHKNAFNTEHSLLWEVALLLLSSALLSLLILILPIAAENTILPVRPVRRHRPAFLISCPPSQTSGSPARIFRQVQVWGDVRFLSLSYF